MTQPSLPAAAFVPWLRQLRLDLKLTRKRLAQLAGLSESTVRNIERGRHTLRVTTAARLFLALVPGRLLARPRPILYKRELGELRIHDRGDRLLLEASLDVPALRRLAGEPIALVAKPRRV
jgi:transcriptional regulator with XRE-family HTH domain